MVITKEMGITEILEKCPKAFHLLQEYGMHCVGCIASKYETLEQAAQVHGINVTELVEKINKICGDK